jgi:hypothetical protein
MVGGKTAEEHVYSALRRVIDDWGEAMVMEALLRHVKMFPAGFNPYVVPAIEEVIVLLDRSHDRLG